MVTLLESAPGAPRSMAARARAPVDGAGAVHRELDLQTPAMQHAASHRDTVALLNKALETELLCVLRYKRLHFAADAEPPPMIAQAFLRHAQEESAHADRLAQRIVALGGDPDFSSDPPARHGRIEEDASQGLWAMVAGKLRAECAAIETYRQTLALLGERDPITRQLLLDTLVDKQLHAQELAHWVASRPCDLQAGSILPRQLPTKDPS